MSTALLPAKSIHKCIEPNISGAWCRKCHFVWTCLRPPKFSVHMQDSLERLLAIVLFYVSWVDVNRWLACQLIAWGIAVILLLELQNRMACGQELQWGHHLQLQLELLDGGSAVRWDEVLLVNWLQELLHWGEDTWYCSEDTWYCSGDTTWCHFHRSQGGAVLLKMKTI